MLQAIFDIEVVTPLFLAGADQATAELRPPSFRGPLRYWYRALIGGIVGGNLAEVRRRETGVFGSAEYGSPISIRVTEVRPSLSPLPLFERAKNPDGTNFLFWSMASFKDSTPHRPPRQYYPPGTRFKLMLTAREKDQQALKEAIIALWLLTNLGGLGARSRRCAGSLAIRCSELPFTPETALPKLLPDNVKSSKDLQAYLQDGLNAIKSFYNVEKLCGIAQNDFDVLAPENCHIWIVDTEKRQGQSLNAIENEILNAIGIALRDYRRSLSRQERKVLGLPLGKRKDRLASPLHLHITALEQGYVCVATFFHKGVNDISYRLIESFAHYFSETGFSPKPISLL